MSHSKIHPADTRQAPTAHKQSWLEEFLALYPALAGVRPEPAWLVPADGPLEVPAQTVLFQQGLPCPGFPLLLEGEARITRSSASGRSLELYRVVPGELCLASSACLFQGRAMTASGEATRPSRIVLVPPAVFEQWLHFPAFRAFVMGLFAQRMADLVAVVDAVAFQRLDQRLADALLGHGPDLAVTHHQLAAQLGTVREIVTRLLRRFEREGWIALGRERIQILDSAALLACAAGQ